MDRLPKDPIMLLSYINTQLRDFYTNPEDLCAALSLDRSDLDRKLGAAGYTYDGKRNQYV